MYTFACKMCGKPLEARFSNDIRQFCSKGCYGKYLHEQKSHEVKIEPSKHRYVHPNGFENLVAGICRQAREDYMKYPPGDYMRMSAERFFKSDYFAVLTELDGDAILRDLSKAYNRKKRRENPDEHGE